MSDEDVSAKLNRGEIVVVGNKMYMMCQNCGKIVQINKPILGSLHSCR